MEETNNEYSAVDSEQVISMRAFAGNLKTEGLRSPQYYRDKSQCLAFHDNASPAEMGYLKARGLKRGYVEAEELISRLCELTPSDNFTLRKYAHPWMQCDQSPIVEEPHLIQPPEAEWLLHQRGNLVSARRPIVMRTSERHRQEAQNHWDKVMEFEQTQLPKLYLLKHMGWSPSGTLFPRYLVKGLHELRKAANIRGIKYYDEQYDKAEIKR
ncbi:MAG: hypothetical protein LQ347_002177 [Umbilicaria vellea]|nr:MAG: hypothetical protein LQ347_002177 [Umbilicaria vellea]